MTNLAYSTVDKALPSQTPHFLGWHWGDPKPVEPYRAIADQQSTDSEAAGSERELVYDRLSTGWRKKRRKGYRDETDTELIGGE